MTKTIQLLFLLATGAWAQNFYADAVIPHIPDGCDWTTTIILLNATAKPIEFSVKFWPNSQGPGQQVLGRTLKVRSSRDELFLPKTSVASTLDPNKQYVLETSGEGCADNTLFGWAEVNSSDALAGYVVMTYKAQDRPAIDTTVPFSSRFVSRFLVPFDNSGQFQSAIALVNPSFDTDAYVDLSFRYEDGLSCEVKSKQVRKGEQLAFDIVPSKVNCPDIAGKRGILEVNTVDFGGSRKALELSGFVLRIRFGQGGIDSIASFPGQAPVGR
ncbi:MAG: hypothetical protein NTW74_06115 [Acidobacteria bacterium]|nr:hypothetical protein [Acidobacteriota bacterium]